MLLAYAKMWLFDELLASDLPEDPWVAHGARSATSRRRCASATAACMPRHPLQARDHRHRTCSTAWSTASAPTFVHRLTRGRPARRRRRSCAPTCSRARCFGCVRAVAGDRGARQPGAGRGAGRDADRAGPAGARATIWFLRSRRAGRADGGDDRALRARRWRRWRTRVSTACRAARASSRAPRGGARAGAGVPERARARASPRSTRCPARSTSPSWPTARSATSPTVGGGALRARRRGSGWTGCAAQIDALPAERHWQALRAQARCGDDVAGPAARARRVDVLRDVPSAAGAQALASTAWEADAPRGPRPGAAARWSRSCSGAPAPDLAMLSVALRELLPNLVASARPGARRAGSPTWAAPPRALEPGSRALHPSRRTTSTRVSPHFNRRAGGARDARAPACRSAPDVVFLQEVQGAHQRHSPASRRLAGSRRSTSSSPTTDWRDFAYGMNAVYLARPPRQRDPVSRYPDPAVRRTWTSPHHALESRGLLHCEMAVPGWHVPLHCINVHLGLLERGAAASSCEWLCRAHPRGRCRTARRSIIAGDFNDWRGAAATATLGARTAARGGLRDAHGRPARASFPGACCRCFALDRIYVRGFDMVGAHAAPRRGPVVAHLRPRGARRATRPR
ncbi:MAG: hypothetical protein MZW92_67570 [Comamonadaceae bacterium]|nr:hypothetical protein [Comamonadaceae bacterium]